jgi:polyisoprenoid-binding protein YceI
MPRVVPTALALLATLPAPALAQDASRTYALTPRGSDVYVVVRNDRDATLSRLGHDHVIYARDFTGTVVWPATPGGACSVDVQVPVTSLIVDPPGLREKAGLDPNGTIPEEDKAKVQRNMWSGGQLSSGQYPAVTFRADHCPGGTGKVKVDGTMTIRGVAKPVSVVMDVAADATSFSASGRFDSAHTTFGFKPFAATALGPRNQDRLSFVVSVRGQAR